MILAGFTIYLIIVLVSTILGITLAHYKNRIWVLWGVVCLFFPPMLLLLVLLPKRVGLAPFARESIGPSEQDEGWFYTR